MKYTHNRYERYMYMKDIGVDILDIGKKYRHNRYHR